MFSGLLSDRVAVFLIIFCLQVIDLNDNTVGIYSQTLLFQTYYNDIKKRH